MQGKRNQPAAARVRLFFALWPEAALQTALHGLAVQQHFSCGGRVMRAETLHLTLLFLGEIMAGRLQELRAVVSGVCQPAFNLELDHIAGWRHNGIVYLVPAHVPPELPALAGELRNAVAGAGFDFDSKPFVPHVTLLRQAAGIPRMHACAPSVSWTVRDFVLVQSVPERGSVRYSIAGRWPLMSALLK